MEPGNNSWYNNDISSNNRYSQIEATISSTGTYTLMAKCFTSPQALVSYAAPTGHCNIYETNPDTNVATSLILLPCIITVKSYAPDIR